MVTNNGYSEGGVEGGVEGGAARVGAAGEAEAAAVHLGALAVEEVGQHRRRRRRHAEAVVDDVEGEAGGAAADGEREGGAQAPLVHVDAVELALGGA